jgi:hypothetical protein
MSKEQIIDEAYVNYGQKIISEDLWMLVVIGWPSTQEEFIDKCKSDSEFSEKWGLKIEERELTPKERIELAGGKIQDKYPALVEMSLRVCDERDTPTKLITLTYKDTIIESYE